jgi:hypothetical protein
MYREEFTQSSNAGNAFTKIIGALNRNARIEKRRPLWSAAITFTLVLIMGSVLWFTYPKEAEKQELNSVPIVKADAGPYKIAPDDPGGMEIPYRDSTVYETIQAKAETPARKVEKLLPESEKPIDRVQLFAGLKTDEDLPPEVIIAQEKAMKKLEMAQKKALEEAGLKPLPAEDEEPRKIVVAPDQLPDELKEFVVVEDTFENASSQTEEVQQAAAEQTDESAVERIVSASVRAEDKKIVPDESIGQSAQIHEARELANTEPAAGQVAAESVVVGKSYFVQLGSVGSDVAAHSEWTRLKKVYASEIGESDYRVKRADLGAKGVYYRIQAGPFDEERAYDLCGAIKQRKPGGCLVIRP